MVPDHCHRWHQTKGMVGIAELTQLQNVCSPRGRRNTQHLISVHVSLLFSALLGFYLNAEI